MKFSVALLFEFASVVFFFFWCLINDWIPYFSCNILNTRDSVSSDIQIVGV